ncbi:hypothetical protein ACFLT9_05920 [Acidobacteriota bacterium]
MKRRDFLEKAGYGAAGFAVFPMAQESGEKSPDLVVRRYDIELEVYEVGSKTRCFKKGDTFKWPQDNGKICTYLMSALDPVIATLSRGGILPWKYAGTPYEKVIDPEGITTEYIRCPDPSEAGMVMKITRTFKDKRTIKG